MMNKPVRSDRWDSHHSYRQRGAQPVVSPRGVAKQVLMAKENEQRRVSRELHDGLSQKLALVEFQIEGMKRKLTARSKLLPELESLRDGVATISEDLQRICLHLHPVVLENLGLEAGLAFLCEDHTSSGVLNVRFIRRDLPDSVPPSVALALYRVVQEALHNVAKHSGAKQAMVQLQAGQQQIRVTVTDAGCGFDVHQVRSKCRLGLISICERAKLLGGHCSIDSEPGRGTRVTAVIPLFSFPQ